VVNGCVEADGQAMGKVLRNVLQQEASVSRVLLLSTVQVLSRAFLSTRVLLVKQSA
jgi:hypothetical protein